MPGAIFETDTVLVITSSNRPSSAPMTSHNPDFFGIAAKGLGKEDVFKVRERLNILF